MQAQIVAAYKVPAIPALDPDGEKCEFSSPDPLLYVVDAASD
jgi:hypothetical protein